MSAVSRDSLSVPVRWKALACAVAAFMAVGLSSTITVRAQDATPAATPAAACDAPDLPPGTPTPMDQASPEAMDMSNMASPVAEATDEADAEVAGQPAEGAEADEIVAAANNLIACVNGGDYEGAVALMTENFLQEEFDLTNPYDAVAGLEADSFSFGDATVENPMTYEDGSVSADVSYMASQYQLAGETWNLVQDGEYWKIDSSDVFTPEFDGDSAVVGINLTESTDAAGKKTYAIEPNAPSVAQSEVLLFHGINAGTEDHEIVVFKLPEGADPSGLLDGSIAESDVTFVGQIQLSPGEQGDMVLEGLEPGVYTLACFFPGPDGVPHIANGMVTQFEVTSAS
jgi:uncharacterized cupredoxin-like copper-binding protein